MSEYSSDKLMRFLKIVCAQLTLHTPRASPWSNQLLHLALPPLHQSQLHPRCVVWDMRAPPAGLVEYCSRGGSAQHHHRSEPRPPLVPALTLTTNVHLVKAEGGPLGVIVCVYSCVRQSLLVFMRMCVLGLRNSCNFERDFDILVKRSPNLKIELERFFVLFL